ncbi:MAG: hypothetical protein ACRELY_06215 [Polyangiaceae bacterium]
MSTEDHESGQETPALNEEEVAPEDRDSGAMRALLQRAMKKEEAEKPAPNLLPAVQRKIRKRSKGKFFADGWSTQNARVSYVLIAMLMLGVVILAYFAMGPMGISR